MSETVYVSNLAMYTLALAYSPEIRSDPLVYVNGRYYIDHNRTDFEWMCIPPSEEDRIEHNHPKLYCTAYAVYDQSIEADKPKPWPVLCQYIRAFEAKDNFTLRTGSAGYSYPNVRFSIFIGFFEPHDTSTFEWPFDQIGDLHEVQYKGMPVEEIPPPPPSSSSSGSPYVPSDDDDDAASFGNENAPSNYPAPHPQGTQETAGNVTEALASSLAGVALASGEKQTLTGGQTMDSSKGHVEETSQNTYESASGNPTLEHNDSANQNQEQTAFDSVGQAQGQQSEVGAISRVQD